MYVNERICFLFFFWKQQCAAWYSGIKSLPVDKTRRVRLIRRLPVTKQSWRTSLKLFHLKLVKLKSAGGAENNTKRCTLNTTSRKRCRERIFKLFFGFKFFDVSSVSCGQRDVAHIVGFSKFTTAVYLLSTQDAGCVSYMTIVMMTLMVENLSAKSEGLRFDSVARS